MARALEAATGAIYDIGYRSYEGARLGRGYAFRTLYVHSLRDRVRAGPRGARAHRSLALFAILCFPATVTVAVAGISRADERPDPVPRIFRSSSPMILALFCAAQAPELVSTTSTTACSPCTSAAPCARTTTPPPSCWPCGRRCSSCASPR